MKRNRKGIIIGLLLMAVCFFGGYKIGEARERYGPIAFEQGKKEEGELDYQRISGNLRSLKKQIDRNYLYDTDKQVIEDNIYKGLFKGLNDPYSSYFTKEEYQSLKEETSGEYAGIGLVVTTNSSNLIEVVSPIKGTPGDRAGLKSGDIITALNGEYYAGDQLDEAVKIMKGKEGEEVVLSIIRPSQGQKSKDYSIKREKIVLQSVESKLIDNNIGYVHILSFDENTSKDFKSQVQNLIDQGAEGLVLDLRNNPGGLLDSVSEIADYLLGEGTIINIVDKSGKRTTETSDADHIDIPMVCLINEGSASASEVLSGALKDHKRAELIGVKTYGKGVIQQVYEIPETGTGYKLTVAEFYTPNGNKIQKEGIKPEIEVKLKENVDRIGIENLDQDNQLQKALEVIKGKID